MTPKENEDNKNQAQELLDKGLEKVSMCCSYDVESKYKWGLENVYIFQGHR